MMDEKRKLCLEGMLRNPKKRISRKKIMIVTLLSWMLRKNLIKEIIEF